MPSKASQPVGSHGQRKREADQPAGAESDRESDTNFHLSLYRCQCGATIEIGGLGLQHGVTKPCVCGMPTTIAGETRHADSLVLIRAGNGSFTAIQDPVTYGHRRIGPVINLTPWSNDGQLVTRHFWLTQETYMTVQFAQEVGTEELLTWIFRHFWVWQLEGASFRYVCHEFFYIFNDYILAGGVRRKRSYQVAYQLLAYWMTYIQRGEIVWPRPFDYDGQKLRLFEMGTPSKFPAPPGWHVTDGTIARAFTNMTVFGMLINPGQFFVKTPLFHLDEDAWRLGRLRAKADWPDECLETRDRHCFEAFKTWLSMIEIPSQMRLNDKDSGFTVLWMKRLSVYTCHRQYSPKWVGTMASLKIT